MIKVSRPGRTEKKKLLILLEKSNVEDILSSFAGFPDYFVLNTLFGALCSPLEQVRWNAVICFGVIVPSIAGDNMEEARVVMRRFLWSLNDESGGIGWGAPESLAEIMCHNRTLRREYLHMLISYITEDGNESFQDGNYLELPMLQRGLLWGLSRLCRSYGDEMAEYNIVDKVVPYLSSGDRTVVGLAIWCLGLLRAKMISPKIEYFTDSRDIIQIYRDNLLQDMEIGFLAKEALLTMSD